MLTTAPASWTVRGTTFGLWALVGLSALYWALKVAGGTPPASARVAPPRAVAAADPAAIARLLGSTPATAAAPAPVATLASRFQLVGVAAGATSGAGAAVISVDGKPARPYRVGTSLDEGLVLQSVQGRKATIAAQRDGPPLLVLELPPLRQQ
ncbi:type II secretion system protein N [Ramlibacter pallidus]|uniref:General secretion pathway protein C n=1 Tax=Ramlibacter pallidus TaxID=2780087 RepID=A0ABR9RZW5_9BURK|nr:type II secretion system protein N [Ramlibacter pallidus]MBE7366764.1 general secretion pathway protein C [Ramlibacter pallidus]